VDGSASTQALVDRGTRALELGRYDEAIAHLRSALASDPDSAVAQNLLGMAHRFRFNALRSRRDKDREIEAFREAVRLDPNYVPALVNLGTSLWWDGQGSEAAGFLTRALALDPFHPERDGIARMVGLGQTQHAALPASEPPPAEATPTAEVTEEAEPHE
jgi:tetratricopeptide (TPR) repeat protein